MNPASIAERTRYVANGGAGPTRRRTAYAPPPLCLARAGASSSRGSETPSARRRFFFLLREPVRARGAAFNAASSRLIALTTRSRRGGSNGGNVGCMNTSKSFALPEEACEPAAARTRSRRTSFPSDPRRSTIRLSTFLSMNFPAFAFSHAEIHRPADALERNPTSHSRFHRIFARFARSSSAASEPPRARGGLGSKPFASAVAAARNRNLPFVLPPGIYISRSSRPYQCLYEIISLTRLPKGFTWRLKFRARSAQATPSGYARAHSATTCSSIPRSSGQHPRPYAAPERRFSSPSSEPSPSEGGRASGACTAAASDAPGVFSSYAARTRACVLAPFFSDFFFAATYDRVLLTSANPESTSTV